MLTPVVRLVLQELIQPEALPAVQLVRMGIILMEVRRVVRQILPPVVMVVRKILICVQVAPADINIQLFLFLIWVQEIVVNARPDIIAQMAIRAPVAHNAEQTHILLQVLRNVQSVHKDMAVLPDHQFVAR